MNAKPVKPHRIIKPHINRTPQQVVDENYNQCELCNSLVKEDLQMRESLGLHFNVCPTCAYKIDHGVCINCGGSTKEVQLKGLCSTCYQIFVIAGVKLKEEIIEGVDFESTMEVTQEGELPEESFNYWLDSFKSFIKR